MESSLENWTCYILGMCVSLWQTFGRIFMLLTVASFKEEMQILLKELNTARNMRRVKNEQASFSRRITRNGEKYSQLLNLLHVRCISFQVKEMLPALATDDQFGWGRKWQRLVAIESKALTPWSYATEACDIVPTGTVLMGCHYFEWLCTYIKVIYLYLSKCSFYLINAVYLMFSVGQ